MNGINPVVMKTKPNATMRENANTVHIPILFDSPHLTCLLVSLNHLYLLTIVSSERLKTLTRLESTWSSEGNLTLFLIFKLISLFSKKCCKIVCKIFKWLAILVEGHERFPEMYNTWLIVGPLRVFEKFLCGAWVFWF